MRTAKIERKTKETDIVLALNLDGNGQSDIASGCGFLDHMLTLFSKHSGFDLTVRCIGDTDVDYHHTVEDIGIALGKAFLIALGEKRGILRYGDVAIPMDEALILAAVDISGRDFAGIQLDIPAEKIGDFDTELCEEFWLAFIREAKLTLHIRQLAGKNSHHVIECSYKAVARALRQAVTVDENRKDEIPSTKGVL